MGLEVSHRFRARGGVALLALLMAAIIAATAAPDQAIGDVTKQFNAPLSLTGGCTVSSLDEVPDPGCPAVPHPPGSFVKPTSVTADFYGDIYVATFGGSPTGSEGKIDVFSPTGVFITEVAFPKGPRALAVDSEGFLYVVGERGELGGNDEGLFALILRSTNRRAAKSSTNRRLSSLNRKIDPVC